MDNLDEIRRIRGDRLRKIREDRGLKQGQVALALDVDPGRYEALENGRNSFSNEMLDIIHDSWGVSVDYLLYGEERNSEDALSILRKSSNEVRLKALLHLIAYMSEDKALETLTEEFDLSKFIEKYSKGSE